MAGQGAAWNYVVTAHRPSNVTHAVTAAFTGPHDLNLIIAK
jgi:DNA damage-binding protein 1